MSFLSNLCTFCNTLSTATFTTGIDAATRQANKAFKSYVAQSREEGFRTCAEIDDLITLPVAELHKALDGKPAQSQPAEQPQPQPEAQPEPETKAESK